MRLRLPSIEAQKVEEKKAKTKTQQRADLMHL